MKDAVIYARVSTKDQEREGYSIPAQLELLREFAEREGYRVLQEFTDTESASEPGRTQFSRMLKFLNKRPVTLLVEKIDRLYRNFRDALRLAETGVEVRFVKQGISLGPDSKSSDKLIHNFNVAMAQNYSDNLSEEVRKGQLQKARSGGYPGGQVSVGYVRNRLSKQIELDPERAPIIRQLFELYASGEWSVDAAHAHARKAGLTYAKSGRHVTRSEIERMLKKPFYAGDFTWNGTVYHGDHPALVDRELFDRVQEAFKRRSNGKFGTRVFTFSRLMTCAACGYTITAEIKKGKHVYYHCTGYGNKHKVVFVPEREIDAQFAQIVEAVTLPWEWYEYVKECLEQEWGNRKTAMEARRKRLTRTRDQIMADMKKAYEDRLHDRIAQEFFQTVHRDQQRSLDEVNFQLSSLPEGIEKRFDVARMAIELSHQAGSLYLRANREQKRKLLKSMLSNCQLDGSTLRPTYEKAFELLAKGIATKDKRGDWDSNPGEVPRSKR